LPREAVEACVTPGIKSPKTDINRAIIERGYALSCPRYEMRYLKFERPEALAVQTRAPYCILH